jgi:hypothetical protein
MASSKRKSRKRTPTFMTSSKVIDHLRLHIDQKAFMNAG